jgi:hypothetical protein
MRTRRSQAPLVLAAAFALLLAACGAEEAARVTSGRAPESFPQRTAELSDFEVSPAAAEDAREALRADAPAATGATPGLLIRHGHMTVRVEAVEPAVEQLGAIAAEMGGFLGDVSVNTGDDVRRHATVQLRVPSDRLDEAIAAVRRVGTVEAVNVSAEDVTDQHADLQARLANARRLEQRILTVLEARTGNLQQILAAERELARVRTEIERYETRLRQLDDRIQLSTLTVRMREPRAIVGGAAGPSVIGEAFRRAGSNFVWTVAGIIVVAGALAPILILLGLAAAPAVVWLRRRGALGATPAAAGHAGTGAP